MNLRPLKRRFCNYSFVEEDVKAGRKLLCCGRCLDTWYVDRTAQRKDWPLHKQFCSGRDPLIEDSINTLSYRDVAEQINYFMENPKECCKQDGRVLLYLWQRFETLWLESPAILDNDMHSRTLINPALNKMSYYDDVSLSYIWGTIGLATFFFSNDLVTPHCQELRAQGLPPPPNNPKDPKDSYNFPVQLPAFYCECIANVIHMTHVRARNMNDIDGQTTTRRSSLGRACARRSLQWWKNPWTRSSVPFCNNEDDLCLRTYSYAATMCAVLADPVPLADDELIPTMTATEVMLIFFQDPAFFRFVPDCYLLDLLSHLHKSGTERSRAWEKVTIMDRIKVLNAYNEWIDDMLAIGEDALDATNALIVVSFALSAQMKTLLQISHQVMLPQNTDKVHPETIEFMKRRLAEMRAKAKPSAIAHIICAKRQHQDLPSLPKEVINHISEFALPEAYPGMKITENGNRLTIRDARAN